MDAEKCDETRVAEPLAQIVDTAASVEDQARNLKNLTVRVVCQIVGATVEESKCDEAVPEPDNYYARLRGALECIERHIRETRGEVERL